MDKVLSLNIRLTNKLLQENVISTQELVNACLDRVKSTTKYNAFITVTGDLAQKQAEESVKRYQTKKILSEFDGLPIAMKDNFCTENIKTTCASKMLENFIPKYNSTVYERLKNAGAILLGKTNLDQFAMGSGTVDSIYGPTKNIWGYAEDNNDFFITGGSSGGSAIAVATGSCYAAIGSDTGGSTRNPASYCGVVGLKPTYGLVSRLGLIPLVNSMDVPGILTRNIDDCVSVLNVIAGHDPKDSTSLSWPHRKIRLPPGNKISIKGLKIGIPIEYYCEHLSSEVLNVWNDVASLLEENGAVVREVSLPNTEYSIVCYSILNQCEVASNMARYDGIEFGFRANEDRSTEKLYATTRSLGFNEVVRNRILTGNFFLLTRNYEKYFNHALKVRRLISADFDNVWNEVELLLTPTTLSTAPLYNDFIKKTNRDQCAVQDYCTQPANMAGIPALSIPIKLSISGMPISLQLLGRNLSEPVLLAVAKFIENVVQFQHKPEYIKLT
ncbi:gatA [Trypoxylus dichotomus]